MPRAANRLSRSLSALYAPRPVRWLAYMATCHFLKTILALVCRTRVLHRERSRVSGGCLLVANHISHFDPPFLSGAIRRKVDWMATRELYEIAPLGFWLRAVDTFPVDREQVDRSAVRESLARLKRGRMVGIFPEGGIRDGAHSVLEGAPLKPGIAALAHLSGAPVVPCVIVGSDQLYTHRNWLPFRRARAWIAFGEPLRFSGDGKAGRTAFDAEISAALRALYAELKERFHLTADDLPQPPMRRKGRV